MTNPLIALAGVLFIGAGLINLLTAETPVALDVAYMFIGAANLSFSMVG